MSRTRVGGAGSRGTLPGKRRGGGGRTVVDIKPDPEAAGSSASSSSHSSSSSPSIFSNGKTSRGLMKAGARARSAVKSGENASSSIATSSQSSANLKKKARSSRFRPKAVKRKGPAPKKSNSRVVVKDDPEEVLVGSEDVYSSASSQVPKAPAAERRARINSVGDAKQSSPIRKQARKIAKDFQARRTGHASGPSPALGRRRKLTESQQKAALLKSEASERLRGKVSGAGEWPPTVGRSGSSVYVPTSLPFVLPDEKSDASHDGDPSNSSSYLSSSADGISTKSRNQREAIDSDCCSAFAALSEEKHGGGSTSAGNRIMLLQIPHLPHTKILDFGAPVTSSRQHNIVVKTEGAKGKASKAQRKGRANSQGGGDTEGNVEWLSSANQGAVPRVGSAYASTDNFTGSGATEKEKPIEQSVRRAEEGLIGKLRVRASGKVELMLGDIPLRVIDGPTCGSYQELVYLQGKSEDDVNRMAPLADKPTLCFLGPVENRVTVIPDVQWLLKHGTKGR